MQIIIDIPEEQIEKCLEESKYIHENEGEKGSVDIVLLYTNKKLEFVDILRKNDFYSLTDKYTVLPKGHGRLIDADLLDRSLENAHVNLEDELSEAFDDGLRWASKVLYHIPTVIKADKEE